MISITQIERMMDHGSHAQLIRRILSNGRCTCPAIRQHLLDRPGGPDTPIIAAGLGLQRCCELSYLPTALADKLAGRLLDAQMPDGRFGIADDTALAATAIALRGLIDCRDQLRAAGEGEMTLGDRDRDLDRGIERGMTAIVRMLGAASTTPDHATGILIAIWQLGHLPSFRERINVEPVLIGIQKKYAHDVDTKLMDYAYAQAA